MKRKKKAKVRRRVWIIRWKPGGLDDLRHFQSRTKAEDHVSRASAAGWPGGTVVEFAEVRAGK